MSSISRKRSCKAVGASYDFEDAQLPLLAYHKFLSIGSEEKSIEKKYLPARRHFTETRPGILFTPVLILPCRKVCSKPVDKEIFLLGGKEDIRVRTR